MEYRRVARWQWRESKWTRGVNVYIIPSFNGTKPTPSRITGIDRDGACTPVGGNEHEGLKLWENNGNWFSKATDQNIPFIILVHLLTR